MGFLSRVKQAISIAFKGPKAVVQEIVDEGDLRTSAEDIIAAGETTKKLVIAGTATVLAPFLAPSIIAAGVKGANLVLGGLSDKPVVMNPTELQTGPPEYYPPAPAPEEQLIEGVEDDELLLGGGILLALILLILLLQ